MWLEHPTRPQRPTTTRCERSTRTSRPPILTPAVTTQLNKPSLNIKNKAHHVRLFLPAQQKVLLQHSTNAQEHHGICCVRPLVCLTSCSARRQRNACEKRVSGGRRACAGSHQPPDYASDRRHWYPITSTSVRSVSLLLESRLWHASSAGMSRVREREVGREVAAAVRSSSRGYKNWEVPAS